MEHIRFTLRASICCPAVRGFMNDYQIWENEFAGYKLVQIRLVEETGLSAREEHDTRFGFDTFADALDEMRKMEEEFRSMFAAGPTGPSSPNGAPEGAQVLDAREVARDELAKMIELFNTAVNEWQPWYGVDHIHSMEDEIEGYAVKFDLEDMLYNMEVFEYGE